METTNNTTTNTEKSLRDRAISELCLIWSLYKKGWKSHDEWANARDFAYSVFCNSEEEKDAFINDLSKEIGLE